METTVADRPASALPLSLPPRGLSRTMAAAYIGVSPTLFDEMVKDGRMPKPKLINSRTVWDRFGLDDAFAALPSNEDAGGKWTFGV
jgi:predicted DNA-binding transcriptional regulator AlpA